MTGRGKGKLGAMLLFALIAVSVVGGMSWATVSSLKLAEKTIAEERLTKLQRAVSEVENYIISAVVAETARDSKEFNFTYAEDPVSIRTRDGRQFNFDPNYVEVEVRSPLAATGRGDDWRPYPWIDLYFQIDSHGKMNSPQVPDETDHNPAPVLVDARWRSAWDWLHRILPGEPLSEKIAEARERDGQELALGGFEASSAGDEAVDGAASNSKRRPLNTTKLVRHGSLLEAQAGYVAHDQCVDPRVVAKNIQSRRNAAVNGDESAAATGGVSMEHTAYAPPFWLEPDPDGRWKLAFVREVFADAEVVYQGFIADWALLRPELLSRVQTVFAGGDIAPLSGETPRAARSDEVILQQLPVALSVPEPAGGLRAAAWRSIRGVLLISWSAAVAVLLIAGWGVMNLVALTERRMQFAYAVTHELRTPLTTFRLYSDMLSAGLVPEESRQDYLDTLNRESSRLSTMVESVLEYARLENQKVKLHLRDTDGKTLLHSISETFDRRCAENGVEPRKVNELTNGQAVRTDLELVGQITGVLVNNACRHARTSTKPAVMLRLSGDNGRVFLDVVDSGRGVDLADSRRIFKPFRRGRDADATARGGIGLGLSLARNWASLLGGRLDLVHRHHPELGGAHFRLTIPTQSS